jgi:predicted site-specific integrase-resolvase
MTGNDKTLTTAEFSQKTGISVSTITQMLRLNKLRGEKRSGKWAIDESELQNAAIASKEKRGISTARPGPAYNMPSVAKKAYDIETFVEMTYLTEKGVRRWLKSGRLSGSTDANGKVLVDAANLDRPELKHLVR